MLSVVPSVTLDMGRPFLLFASAAAVTGGAKRSIAYSKTLLEVSKYRHSVSETPDRNPPLHKLVFEA